MSPRVSVVMAAYQAEATVGSAVESVLGQSYRDFELIVVDDGSTDATAAITTAHNGPLKLLHRENGGVGAARNLGIAEATGELVTFCDADDQLFERHLQALVDVYDEAGTGLATSNSYWLLPGGIHPSKVRYKGRFPEPDRQRSAILEQNFLSTMTLFPRRLVDEVGQLAGTLNAMLASLERAREVELGWPLPVAGPTRRRLSTLRDSVRSRPNTWPAASSSPARSTSRTCWPASATR